MYSKFLKRIFDFTVAFFFVILTSPLLIALAIAVRIKNGSPVLFVQKRIGRGEKPFYIYKFRSMNNAKDTQGKLLPDKDRLTSFGKIIRKTSLDELPQFFNVLKGDMSFVGPRPLLERYLPYYTQRERLRHSVLPGITGLAQINGRNNLTWDRKLEYDAEYAENVTFYGDILILIKTAWKVLKKEDVNLNTGIRLLDKERSENKKNASCQTR